MCEEVFRSVPEVLELFPPPNLLIEPSRRFILRYTMEDVERDVTRLPPQFVAHGVDYEGGIYNKPMEAGFTYADVDAAINVKKTMSKCLMYSAKCIRHL